MAEQNQQINVKDPLQLHLKDLKFILRNQQELFEKKN